MAATQVQLLAHHQLLGVVPVVEIEDVGLRVEGRGGEGRGGEGWGRRFH